MLDRILIVFVIFLLSTSCKSKTDYYNLPLLSFNKNFNAVIEIPAGTNKKFEYNEITQAFEVDKKNGKDRVIQFLPYIGNYGYIPSTYSDPTKGGDGDALDVLVLSESIVTGAVIEVSPIAILKLLDDGEIDYKIIAIPTDETKQILKVNTYEDFLKDFSEVKTIIELWFLNYNKDDEVTIQGWGNEKEAIKEIYKNKIKK